MLNRIGSLTRRSTPVAGLVCAFVLACGGDDDGISYNRDVRPLVDGRCNICHYTGGPIGVDIEAPFAQGSGLVFSPNSWAEAYPGETDARNVVPGNPAESFLIDKLRGNLPANGHGGDPMPPAIPRLTPEEVATVRAWIADGATEADYLANVRSIFGEGSVGRPGKCSLCHYSGTPNPPDLVNPYNPARPEEGIIDVPGRYRSDLMRVAPGNPDASFLMIKVTVEESGSEYGPTMPYSYNPLTEEDIQVVEEWILNGALEN